MIPRGFHRSARRLLGIAVLGLAVLQGPPVEAAETDGSHASGSEHDQPGAHHPSFNWFHGFLGEKAGVEPSLFWRSPGTPVPFLALLINYGLLYYLLVRFSRRPIAEALRKRRTTLMQGIAEASKMRIEAESQLEDGKQKLKGIEDQIVQVKDEIRAAAEAERIRVLREAEEKRARMARDASVLVEQEWKAAREQLHRETVESAVRSAEASLVLRLAASDHERIQREYLQSIDLGALSGSREIQGEPP